MSILLNTISFTESSSTPAFQNWHSPTPTQFVYVQTGGAVIYPVVVNVKFKDFIGTTEGLPYSAFRIKARKYYINSSYGSNWLIVGSVFFETNIQGSPSTKNISSNGTDDTLTLSVQNLSLLNVGNYEARIVFTIEGLNASGVWSEISSYNHVITFSVYENEQVTWTPNNFILNYYQGTPRPEKTIIMNGPLWSISTPVNFILESDDPEVTITSSTSSSGTQYFATGSGEREIKLKIGDYFTTPAALSPGSYNRGLFVFTGASTLIGSISFTLNVLSPGDFYVDPSALNFEATKGGTEPMAIDVFVYAENPYTITHPHWLIVTPSEEVSPGIFANLNAVPIPHSNLAGGTYTGDITLSSNDGGTIVTISIPITYVLHEFVTLPYSISENNFTKDPLFLEFYTQIPDTYFDVSMDVQVTDWLFQGGTTKNYNVPFKVPLYNKFQKENIGLRIEKMMAKFNDVNVSAERLYQPAVVTISIAEKQYPSHTIMRETTLTPIKFLSGITPKLKNGDNAILELSNGVKKITANSFDFLNLMLETSSNKTVEISVNGNVVSSYPLFTTHVTNKLKIEFSDFVLKQGDIVVVKVFLEATNTQFISKQYIVYPEPEYSNMIIWEDDFKMMQTYEFTGKHSVKNDYAFSTFKKYKNLIEHVKNIDTTKVNKLFINTGFIPKSDIIYLDSILSGRRVWLYLSDSEIIELSNETKSLVFDDVDRELNSFDLEFTINRTRNEENNSF